MRKKITSKKKRVPPSHQRKRGPKKKRGPKPLPPPPPPNYKIAFTYNGNENKAALFFKEKKEAMATFMNLVDTANKNVIFPKRFVNIMHNPITPLKSEILLLKLKGEEEQSPLRNDFGALVDIKTTSGMWNIIKKEIYEVEETFYVYGYDLKHDRKTFTFILEDLIINKAQTEIIMVGTFKNKLLIEIHDDMDIVMCKNIEDCHRVYNTLEKCIDKRKVKNVFFVGGLDGKVKSKRTIEKIMKKTNWNLVKVNRKSTRP